MVTDHSERLLRWGVMKWCDAAEDLGGWVVGVGKNLELLSDFIREALEETTPE